jgi:predicted DCC family thiol-disulfide oxidoreductase YuxK
MILIKNKYKHLVLFDGDCPFCNLAVRHVIAIDKKKYFVFSPLNSKIAHELLKDNYQNYIEKDTLILIEDYKLQPRIFIRSKAVLRIYWQIGRFWKILGLISFFPAEISDLLYRLFAIYRYQLKIKMPNDSISKDRIIF